MEQGSDKETMMPEGVGYGGMGADSATRSAQKSSAYVQAQRSEDRVQSGREARPQTPGVDVQISQRAQQGGQPTEQQSDTYADPRGRSRAR